MRITKNMLEDYICSLGVKELKLQSKPPVYSLLYLNNVFLEGTIREVYCFLQGMDIMSKLDNGLSVDLTNQQNLTFLDLKMKLNPEMSITVRKYNKFGAFNYKNHFDICLVSVNKEKDDTITLKIKVKSSVLMDNNTLVCRDMDLGNLIVVLSKEKTKTDVLMLLLKVINYRILRNLSQICDTTLIPHMLWTSKSDLWALSIKEVSYLCDEVRILSSSGVNLK